jgi:hypothetical protein
LIVQGRIAQQGLLHVFAAVEAVGLQSVRNAATESFDHAVGSRCPGLGQPVLYAELLAQLVEPIVTAGFAFPPDKQAIRELLAVVGRQLGDPDRTSLVQCLEEDLLTGSGLVGLESPRVLWRLFCLSQPTATVA